MGCGLIKKAAKTAAPRKVDERNEKISINHKVYVPERPMTGIDFRKISAYLKVEEGLMVIKEAPSELEISPQKKMNFKYNFV